MEKVEGFGGFFFRAHDPTGLAAWYAEYLGIDPVPADSDTPPWSQEAGPTVFAPFPWDSDYFGDGEKVFMLNFRVTDLDAMLAQLRAAGIAASETGEMPGIGRFARLEDPEGNPIELWEPED